MRAGGWSVERAAHEPGEDEPQLGDLVIGPSRVVGGRTCCSSGMDTVFDEGTVAERPFRIEGDLARGRESDMKGGLLTGFHAVDVLQEARFGGFGRITYVCNPDEEIGSPMSGPRPRARARARRGVRAGGAQANGDIVSARKGITDYASRVRRARRMPASSPRRGRCGARGRESDDRDAGAERSLARGDRERRRSGHPHERGG